MYSLPPPTFSPDGLPEYKSRYKHLLGWTAEWSAELALRTIDKEEVPDNPGNKIPLPADNPDAFETQAYDTTPLRAGSVRLLSASLTKDKTRPTYVLILGEWTTDWSWFIPFSTFDSPATENELRTNLEPVPLRVLQVWHALSCPDELLARSWFVTEIDETLIKQAKAVYSRLLRGDNRLPEEIVNSVGTRIQDPSDPRILYLQEESKRLAPISTQAIDYLELRETSPQPAETISFPIPLPRSLQEEQLAAADSGDQHRLQVYQVKRRPDSAELSFSSAGMADLQEGPFEDSGGKIFATFKWSPLAMPTELNAAIVERTTGKKYAHGSIAQIGGEWTINFESGEISELMRCSDKNSLIVIY